MVRKYKTSAIQIIYIFHTINHQQHPKPRLKSCECRRSQRRDAVHPMTRLGPQPFLGTWETVRSGAPQSSWCGGEHSGRVLMECNAHTHGVLAERATDCDLALVKQELLKMRAPLVSCDQKAGVHHSGSLLVYPAGSVKKQLHLHK